MYHLTALVTLSAVAFYFYVGLTVGWVRQRTGIKAPATTGNPDFERAYRVQMNTLEWMPIFLPALWLCASYAGDRPAAAIGAVWVVGRLMYMQGYIEDAAKRGPGFAVQALAAAVLWIGALIGVVRTLLAL